VTLQELSSQRSEGQQLLLKAVEGGQKLCQHMTADAGLLLTSKVTEFSSRCDTYCHSLDNALERLSEQLGASNKYLQCVDDVHKWLTEAEKNISETVYRADMGTETGIHLERLRKLLGDLEENQEKLEMLSGLEKRCQINSSKQAFNNCSTKYDELVKNLKVCFEADTQQLFECYDIVLFCFLMECIDVSSNCAYLTN
jgi:hypothetical protein